MGTIRKPISRRILRGIIGQATARPVATVFYLHYGALCFCVGFIIGATNPYYDLWTVLKITAFASTGFATAALLQAATNPQEGASRSRRTDSQPDPYHTHHGPLGLVNHATDHDPGIGHYGSFLYDQQRYIL